MKSCFCLCTNPQCTTPQSPSVTAPLTQGSHNIASLVQREVTERSEVGGIVRR